MITTLDKHTALVLIDFQKAILRQKTAHPLDGILKNASLLVDAFRKENLPIIVITVNPFGASWLSARKDNKEIPKSKLVISIVKLVMSLTGGLKVIPTINVQPTDVFIEKKTWNAFYNTTLDKELKKRTITNIVLAGVATSIGVEGTARAASELGYNIALAEDAMTDTTLEAHQNSIKHIFPRLGEIGITADIIKKLPTRA